MRSLLVLVLPLVAMGSARADIAPPEPEHMLCPRGAKGAGNGVSVWCEPTTCANDVTCGEGYRCSEEDIGLCVESIEVATERFRPSLDENAPPREIPMARVRSVRERGCEPNGTCLNVDSTCEHARRCVREDPRPPHVSSANLAPSPAPASASGCACRTADAGGAWPWLVLLALRRRRG